MKKSNSKGKAPSAFKKLGAVALITATLAMCFTACNQTGGGGGKPTPTPTPKPKHAINFSVDGANGTLTAKADGNEIASGKEVEEGKTVTFTAEPSANYKVKEWKVGNTVVTGNNSNTYSHKVTKACTVKVSFELIPIPSVEGGAVLILSPDKLAITLLAKTADGSDIAVEGCTVATLASGRKTTLTATGTKVVLKGKIIELSCSYNKLTALNVQGLTSLQELVCWSNQLAELNVQGCASLQKLNCSHSRLTALNVQGLTSLQELGCHKNKLTELNVQGLTALQTLACSYNQLANLNVQGCTSLQYLNCYDNQLTALNVQGLTDLQRLNCYVNQLNAQAMTEVLNALPTREAGDDAIAMLYTEEKNYTEGNCKDLTQPESLKKALEGAKKRNWTLKKVDVNGSPEDI